MVLWGCCSVLCGPVLSRTGGKYRSELQWKNVDSDLMVNIMKRPLIEFPPLDKFHLFKDSKINRRRSQKLTRRIDWLSPKSKDQKNISGKFKTFLTDRQSCFPRRVFQSNKAYQFFCETFDNQLIWCDNLLLFTAYLIPFFCGLFVSNVASSSSGSS